MSLLELVRWLRAHADIFSELEQAVTASSTATSAAQDAAERDAANPGVNAALCGVASTAEALLARCQEGLALPPIPDSEAQRWFVAALDRWSDSAVCLRDAASGLLIEQLRLAVDEQRAGTDDFLRMAVALHEAAGAPG